METSGKNIIIFRSLFRTQSKIYDEAFFCENSWRVKMENCFSKKSSIVNVRMGSKYACGINHQITPGFYNSGILIYPRTVNLLWSHKVVEILKSFISLTL